MYLYLYILLLYDFVALLETFTHTIKYAANKNRSANTTRVVVFLYISYIYIFINMLSKVTKPHQVCMRACVYLCLCLFKYVRNQNTFTLTMPLKRQPQKKRISIGNAS